MPFSLILLALGAFVIGTSEFVIVGLLQVVSKDFQTTVPNAGLLVSFYAIGVVIGAPLFTLITGAVRRDRLLFGLLALFSIGNLICALAPNYSTLMLGRIVAAMAHGSFFGVGAVVATHLVPPNRCGRAIAVMFFGLTLANVMGVPLGAVIGQEYGWRTPFWIITVLGGGVATMLVMHLPPVPGVPAGGFRKEIAILADRQVIVALSITVFTLASIFTVFTYVSELLAQQGHADAVTTSMMLLLFGVGMTAGVANGGRLADRWPDQSALILSALLTASLAAFAITKNSVGATGANLFITGLCGASLVPGLQARVLRAAQGAPNLASSFNIGAFNVGNALGAGIGSEILARGWGLEWLAIACAVCGVCGFVATVTAVRTRTVAPSPVESNIGAQAATATGEAL